ncbi:hypothetical protein SDJN03_28367, partial [Cucurbita argyrosperma subsp. sororia]
MKSGLSRVLNFSRQNQTPSFHLHLHLLNAPLFLAAAPESASEDLDSLFFVFFIVDLCVSFSDFIRISMVC